MRKVNRALGLRIPGFDPLDSDLETRVLRVIAAAGLPVPRQQYPIVLGGTEVHLDLAYPEARLAIELDGWEWHRNRSAFDDDRWRDVELVKLRWMNLRLTATMSDQTIVEVIGGVLADRLLTQPREAWSREQTVRVRRGRARRAGGSGRGGCRRDSTLRRPPRRSLPPRLGCGTRRGRSRGRSWSDGGAVRGSGR